jgi:lipoate-protein ligase A
MQLLDRTLPTPQENLACDEALLELCDAGHGQEILRFWEPVEYFVVVGYSNKTATEANVNACRERGVPILRRCTGGGTVLQGPGCLNYSLLLQIHEDGPLRGVTETNCFVMKRHRDALQPLVDSPIKIEGYTDLATGGLKFSGNAQRRGKRFVLFHGSFLLRFDLSMIERLLPMPSRQPEYRQGRSHTAFLRNLELSVPTVKDVLLHAWNARPATQSVPMERIQKLVEAKYATDQWNYKA